MTITSTFRLLLISFFFISCKEQKENKEKIVIATAANMQFVMKELVKAFHEEKNIECDLVVGSSGKLTAQIKEGAPYDVFVAANLKYPEEIHQSGLSYSVPKVYAFGKVVLWTTNNNIKPNLDILNNKSIHHIAIANPNTAPYGFAALEILKKLNLYNDVNDKLVFGESISQTNQFITLQSAEVGFTAMSVVLSPELKLKGNWIEIDNNYYSPIEQGVVIIKHKNQTHLLALEFYDFLFSSKAKKILISYGYDIP